MDSLPNFLEISAGSTIGLSIRYAAAAGLAWLLGYVLFVRRWSHRKIIPRLPAAADVWREIGYSALSVVIFGLVAGVTAFAVRQGWTQLYWRIDQHGWVWFCLSVFLAIVLHDTYFYWTHRLMHHRRLFRPFHRVHHLSHNPSPWAAYSFAPLEAVVEAGIFPLAITLIPMHPFAFVIFMGWQITYNVLGHTGYEFHPRWLMDSWLGRVLNTPTNHAMHHEKMTGNYGLYFNIWDRLMGTNHPSYEDRFREVTSRVRPEPASEPGRSAAPASATPVS